MNTRTKIILSIILALLPIISFVLYYAFSVQGGTLDNLKENYALYYLDFLFIIFNLLFVYAIRINYRVLKWSFVFSTIVLSVINFAYWTFQDDVSVVHLIFSIIEMGLLITAIFSKTIDRKKYVYMMIPILIYFLIAFILETFIYRREILEAIPHLIGLIVVSLRLVKPNLFLSHIPK
ncbi:MAG: hypothetical protein ACP5NV_00680 [Candidatus Woesearchaeota archaeon]